MTPDFWRWTFLHPERVHLLWAAAFLVGLLIWLETRGRAALGRFVSAEMQASLVARPSAARRWTRLGSIAVVLVCGVLALMRPQTARRVATTAPGKAAADVVVALDVSRSMLAADATPSRLERAKAELRDLLEALDGDRVGLVAFAGRAAALCPVTSDFGFVRMVLDTVGPNMVGRGGTRLGDAIRKAVAAFPPGSGAKVLVLMTDGEDQDSYPLDAAKEALRAGVRIVAIGFGDEKGSEIALVDPKTGGKSVLTDADGHPVRSRLDGETLRQVALATEGAYVPAGVAVLDLESIVKTHIEPLVREPGPDRVRLAPREEYPWLLLAALIALVDAARPGRMTRTERTRRSAA